MTNQMTNSQAADIPVKSPCISVCVLNEEDICKGCYRSAREITDWNTLDNSQKRTIMKDAQARFKRFNKDLLL